MPVKTSGRSRSGQGGRGASGSRTGHLVLTPLFSEACVKALCLAWQLFGTGSQHSQPGQSCLGSHYAGTAVFHPEGEEAWAQWLNGTGQAHPRKGTQYPQPLWSGLWATWREGSRTVLVDEPLPASPFSSSSVPECLHRPACMYATGTWQLGGSGCGAGGLSAGRVREKWGVGARGPVRPSGQAWLAHGVLRTLQFCFLQHRALGS